MSTISNLIFNNQKHFISSSFGVRDSFSTENGATGNNHEATDYATYNVKLPQYAIESGYVFEVGKSTDDGALYVWVIYPRIKYAFLHYHLDSYKVKSGQSVSKGTLLGYTGMTGRATGIHLHLGVRNLSKLSDSHIKKMTWNNLTKCPYVDPEKISYKASSASKTTKTIKTATQKKASFFPSKGYFTKGDSYENIGKIASFLRQKFPSYTDKKALGNLFGPYLVAAVKEFQRRTGLEADGNIGPITLEKLKSFGFKE